MKILYCFSSPSGDVIVDDATLARPFVVSPFQDHPFMTLGDYFLAIRDFILRENGHPLTRLLGSLWGGEAETGNVDTTAIRYEKYGTLYHISSVEILAASRRVRLAVSVAVTDESKEALDREFDLLQQLGNRYKFSHLPRVYCKHAVRVQKGEGSETLLMTLSEWFENYHEWHFSRDEKGRERIIVWDMEGGYRFMSEQEAYEIVRQASAILTCYYSTKTCQRIFPWHHGAGDFVVKAAEGAVDVKLITARGYEPILPPPQAQEADPVSALILFFLETTVKMRLDKREGMGESTWADASAVEAATEGFFQALRMKESKGDTGTIKIDDVIKRLKAFTVDKLKIVLRSYTDGYRVHGSSDYEVMLTHADDHARDAYRVIQSLETGGDRS